MNIQVRQWVFCKTNETLAAFKQTRKIINKWAMDGKVVKQCQINDPYLSLLLVIKTPDRETFIKQFADWLSSPGIKKIPLAIQREAPDGKIWCDFGFNHQYSLDLLEKMMAINPQELKKDVRRWITLLFHDFKKVNKSICSDAPANPVIGSSMGWFGSNAELD